MFIQLKQFATFSKRDFLNKSSFTILFLTTNQQLNQITFLYKFIFYSFLLMLSIYIKMDQQPNSISPTKYFTNSLLKIALHQTETANKPMYQWISHTTNNQTQDFKAIFGSEEVSKNNKNQYQCNPLDYGQIIIAKAVIRRPDTNFVVKQIKFGPIGLEAKIFKYFSHRDRQNVSFLLNKTEVNGSIKIVACPFVLNNNYKVSILIRTQNLNFQLKIQKQIKLIPGSTFFKFYPRQTNSVGISFYHQQSQFMNKLRQLNIFVHSGYYLKIQFAKREYRDAFLIQLMQYFGLIEQQPQQHQHSMQKINTQRQRRASNISGLSEKRRNAMQSQNGAQLDDQIFKILYNGQEQQKRVSFSFTDAQFLLSSMRKSAVQRMQNIKTLKELTEQDKVQKDRNFTQKRIDHKKNEQLLGLLQVTNNEFHNRSARNFLKERKFQQISPMPFSNNQATYTPIKEHGLRETISKLTHQIESLLKQNRRLSQENKKLKEQNMKFRFKQIKKTFKQIFKQKGINGNYAVNSGVNPQNLLHYKYRQERKNDGLHSSKASSIKNIKILPKDSKNNLKISSFGTNRQVTIESPNSNGTSEISSNSNIQDRKKTQSNFASMMSASNSKFIKQKSRHENKFVPRIKSRGKSFGSKSKSKNSRSQTDNSFQKPDETPSTPFFTAATYQQAFNVKNFQSNFFRQYISQKRHS